MQDILLGTQVSVNLSSTPTLAALLCSGLCLLPGTRSWGMGAVGARNFAGLITDGFARAV